MSIKLVDGIEVFATAAGGVPIALAEAFAAGLAVVLKQSGRIEVFATAAAGGVKLPP